MKKYFYLLIPLSLLLAACVSGIDSGGSELTGPNTSANGALGAYTFEPLDLGENRVIGCSRYETYKDDLDIWSISLFNDLEFESQQETVVESIEFFVVLPRLNSVNELRAALKPGYYPLKIQNRTEGGDISLYFI